MGVWSTIDSYKKKIHYFVNGYNLKTVNDIDIGPSDAYIECYG